MSAMLQPIERKRRYVAAVGDANEPMTWSGIPYHFLQAGRALGALDDGLVLRYDGPIWQLRRFAWNGSRVIWGDRHGGFHYSREFLERYWARALPRLRGAAVLNCYQLFAPSVVADPAIERWYFIDATLVQLFEHYGNRRLLGRRIAREALARERDGLQAARGVITHSGWAAASVVGHYGVPADRVHVVVPGANIDRDRYLQWEAAETQRRERGRVGGPLRLVFVGVDWRRKGLDRLLRALRIARAGGADISLRVIGCTPAQLPADLRHTGGVEWLGFMDKRREAERFLSLVAEADVGCLLSRAEAGGIAYREYHALGLGVLGTAVGGSPDHVLPAASIMADGQATDDEIAAHLALLARDRERREAMRAASWAERRTVLWDHAVRQVDRLLGGAVAVRSAQTVGGAACAGS